MNKVKSDGIILSICVPTYNQPNNIERLLQNLSKQSTPEIEILILDDSINDETGIIVKKYISKIPGRLRYFKGKKAEIGGYDAALIFLIESASGKYVWWLGDDVLENGAINKVLETIKKFTDISLIWINSCDINDRKVLGLDFGGDRFFKNANEVFETDVGLLFFSSIIKRDEAIPVIEESKRFIGTAVAGFYLVLNVLSGKGKFYFIQKPLMLCTAKPSGEARWYDSFQVHGFNYFLVAKEFENKFNKKSFKKGIAKQFGQICRAVLVERALGFTTGFGSETPKVKKMFKYYWSFKEFWLALPFFLIPRFILKYLYEFFKFARLKKRILLKNYLLMS